MRPGEIIAGRFEIVRSVRSGGLSVVFEAVDRKTSQQVAVKIINIQPSEEALLKRIDREIKILTSLSHPHIVGCIGAGFLPDSRPYLVLEWLEGEDLADFKVRAPMTLRRVLEVAGQVADALAAAHTLGIIHRDIKPANIYLVRPAIDARPDCRVLDFGVAKMPQATAAITRAGAILGTPSYMAPEQASYAMDVDARADVFSLGVVTFELLTGKLPWQSTTDLARLARILVEPAIRVHAINEDVPGSVADLIDNMLKLKVSERIASARDVHDLVINALADLPQGVLDTTFTRDADLLSNFVREDTADIPPPRAISPPRIPSVRDLRTEGVVFGASGAVGSILEAQQRVDVVDMREVRDAREDAKNSRTPTRGTDAMPPPRPRSLVTEALPAPEREGVSRTGRPQVATIKPGAKENDSIPTQLFDASTTPPSIPPELTPTPMPPSTVLPRSAPPQDVPIPRGRSSRPKSAKAKKSFDDTLSYVEGQDSVLFGRVQEVEALRAAILRPVHTSRPSYILVSGPAGIGKTRVRVELTKIIRGSTKPPLVFSGRAEEVAQSTPYSFLRRVLAVEARIHSDDPPDKKRSKMIELLPNAAQVQSLLRTVEPALLKKSSSSSEDQDEAAIEDHDMIAAFLARVLGAPYHANLAFELAERDPRLMGDQVRRAFDVALRHLAIKRSGLVILIDDAHFLDHQSALVLRELIRPDRQQPIVVVAFALPQLLDGDGNRSPLAGAFSKTMELEPLDARASREFARSLVKGSVESSALELLIKRAAGNPLYLEQLVLAVQVTGALTLTEGGEYELKGMKQERADDDLIPPTVAAAVAARISGMRHPLQKALTTAAVFGDVFWVEGVARLLDSNLEDVTILLDNLVLANLVRRRQGTRYHGQLEMEFTHGVIRSVALSRVKRKRRHKLERHAVSYFESVGETDRAMIALHVAHSGRTDRAAKLFAEAAAESLAIGAMVAAAMLADEGLLLCESSTADTDTRQILFDLAERTAMLSSDHDSAFGVLDQLESMAQADADRARIFERRATLAMSSRRLSDSARFAEEAIARWKTIGPPSGEQGEARSRIALAEAHEAMRDSRTALREFIGAHAVLSAVPGAVAGLVRTTRGLARIAVCSGDYRTAENRFKESLVHAEALGDREAIFSASLGLAEVAMLTGDAEASRARIDEATKYAEHADRHLYAEIRWACLLADEAHEVEAIETLERVLTAAEGKSALGPIAWLAALHFGRTAVELEGASVARVKKQVAEALAAASGAAPLYVPALEITLAHLEAEDGRAAEGKKIAADAVRRFSEEGAIAEEEPPRILRAQARILEASEASEDEIRAAWRASVEELDRIASRLDRKLRKQYLDRAISKAILKGAENAGLKLSRHASSNRIAAL